MSETRDIAIVLKTANYKEKDLVLSIISKTNGRLSICARGVRGGSKRFSGGIDIFDCAEIIIKKTSRGSNLESLTRVETWSNFSKNPKLYCIASTCLETVMALTDEQDPQSHELFMPLFLSLRALNKSSSIEEQNSILVYFLICLLETTGFGLINSTNEDIRTWFEAMQNQSKPIIPNNKEIIDSAKKFLISQIESIKGRKISSVG